MEAGINVVKSNYDPTMATMRKAIGLSIIKSWGWEKKPRQVKALRVFPPSLFIPIHGKRTVPNPHRRCRCHCAWHFDSDARI